MQQTSDQLSKWKYVKENEPFELIIPGYPKGSDITVLNTSYIGKYKDEETGKTTTDYISILFRDNKTKEKMVYTIYEPLHNFYKINEKVMDPPSHNLFFAEKEKVSVFTCKHSDILKAIAEVTGRMQEYKDNVANNNYSENRKLHADPRILFSDTNIENYYRFLFNLSYKNEPFNISKGFLDIETDTRYSDSRFPEPGEVPINAIAYCDEAHNTVYQFILNDPNNPLVEKYKNYCKNTNVVEELHNFVIKSVGGIKNAIKFGVDKMDYKLAFFDDELELIKTMFSIVHYTIPDFLVCWNMAFDLSFIAARIEKIGGDVLSILGDPRLKDQYFKYYIDTRNANNLEERGDYVNLSSYTVYLDQMIEFASRRKGRGQFQSFKLDAIGEVIAGVKKLDYSHITNDIAELPYLDMKTFSFYNVMDVIVQKCIEKNTKDLEYVFTKCLINNTNYAKCHRQSVYLANRFTKEFYTQGYVIGNNKNLWNEKPATKFPGAAVGDPLHNDPRIMIRINGRPTLLCDNTIDFDYKSLYPSIILENNIAPNTQIGKIVIEDKDNPDRRFSLMEHHSMYSNDNSTINYSRGGEFLENLICKNPMEFGRRWMGLGSVYDVIDDIFEFYKFNGYTDRPLNTRFNDAIYFVKQDSKINAITINDKIYMMNPLIFNLCLNDNQKQILLDKVKENAVL